MIVLDTHIRDPQDRLIIATALAYDATLISVDEKFADYLYGTGWVFAPVVTRLSLGIQDLRQATGCRHTRENGYPVFAAGYWIPARAGMTVQDATQGAVTALDSRARGNDGKRKSRASNGGPRAAVFIAIRLPRTTVLSLGPRPSRTRTLAGKRQNHFNRRNPPGCAPSQAPAPSPRKLHTT
jgi:hypothetical protein